MNTKKNKYKNNVNLKHCISQLSLKENDERKTCNLKVNVLKLLFHTHLFTFLTMNGPIESKCVSSIPRAPNCPELF